MDIYVVDANLLFSAILNDKSRIGKFIQETTSYGVKLYAPERMQIEILNHKDRILKISGYSEERYTYVRDKLYKHIEFIEDRVIPFDEFIHAMRIVRNIDPDDVHFVALTNYLGKLLWTGDVTLYKGLKARGYNNVVMFKEIVELYKL
jgi:predicted nucleic acid-binding protein